MRSGRRVAHQWVFAMLAGAVLCTPLFLRANTPTRRNPARQGALARLATPPGTEQPKFKGIWEPTNYNQDVRLTDVFFVTREVGYVSGRNGTILKTVDGGKTWTSQLGGDPQSQEPEINHLRFLDRTHGWAVQAGAPPKLLRTVDGENWEQVGAIPTRWDLLGYQFISPSVGILLDGNNNVSHIFRTIDGGRNWKEVLPTESCKVNAEVQGLNRQLSCTLWTLNMVSPSVGYILGRVGYEKPEILVVAKTADGGASWSLTAVQGPGTMFDYNGSQWMSSFFTDENNGVLATGGDRLYATGDGGKSWRGLPGTAPGPVQFADPEVGWSFHVNKLSFTTDGGKRWSSRGVSFPAWADAFSLPRRDRAYVVGDHGMVYRYRVVPVSYQAAAHSLDAPVMPGFDTPVFSEVATLNDVVAQLRVKLPAVTPTSGQALMQPSAQSGGQAAMQASAQAAAFQQDTNTPSSTAASTAPNPAVSTGASSAPGFPQAGTVPGAAPASTAGSFTQDTGTGPVAGGYMDSCCGPLIQQLETTANSFATNVPAFSQRFRNLNLILEGLNLVNNIVGQTNTLKQSIRALRQAKNAQAAAVALGTVQTQVNGISSSGGFTQDVTTPPQP